MRGREAQRIAGLGQMEQSILKTPQMRGREAQRIAGLGQMEQSILKT
jgi:hypothetical protein